MSTSSDSAEQFIRLCLDETEFALKITGSAVKNIVAALYVISKDTSSKKGKASLNKMLRSENELKIFSIKKEEMKIFAREAKTYGVYYTTLINKNNKSVDSMIDIMVGAKDAPKVNRIIERFKLTTVDKVTVEKAIEQNKMIDMSTGKPKDVSENAPDIGVETKDVEDSFIDDMFSKPSQKADNHSPLESQTEKNNPLENFSMSKSKSEEGATKPAERRSVMKELKEIKENQKAEEELKKAQRDIGSNMQSPIQLKEPNQPKPATKKVSKKER